MGVLPGPLSGAVTTVKRPATLSVIVQLELKPLGGLGQLTRVPLEQLLQN